MKRSRTLQANVLPAGWLLACAGFAVAADPAAKARPPAALDHAGQPGLSLDGFSNLGVRQVLQALDRNADGSISRAEVEAANGGGPADAPALEFDAVDTDRDGHLSPDEIGRAIRNHPATSAAFKAGDVDGDGLLSGAEQAAGKIVPQFQIHF